MNRKVQSNDWLPARVDASQHLADFEARVLAVPTVAPTVALDLRDAVREVVLERSSLSTIDALSVADVIYREATEQGYDPLLVVAMIHIESNFDPEAVSPRGARGLMQVMPRTASWLEQIDGDVAPPGEDPAQRSEKNIVLGVKYLARLHRTFGRIDRALQAYHCGPERLRLVLNDKAVLPFETEVYAQRVLHRYQRLQRQYAYLRH